MGERMGVRRAVRTDVPVAARLLAEALASNIWLRFQFPAGSQLLEILETAYRAYLDMVAFPHLDTWMSTDGGAVAVWTRPQSDVPESALTALSQIVSPLMADRLPEARHAQSWAESQIPRVPHWRLEVIGTSPHRQRQGLGSAVLVPALRLSDRDRVPAYVQTSTNGSKRFYEKLGFVVTSSGCATAVAPHVWTMLREPTPSSDGETGRMGDHAKHSATVAQP